MSSRPRVRFPNAREDHPRPLALAITGTTSLLLGLAFVYAVGRSLDSGTAPELPPLEPAPETVPAAQPNEHDDARAAKPTPKARASAKYEPPVPDPPAPEPAAEPQPIELVQPSEEVASTSDIAPALPGVASAEMTSEAPPPPTPTESAQPEATPITAAPEVAAQHDQRPLEFEHSFVAYLRCDGVPRQPGKYPCPRDLPLERRVWQILGEIPQRCALDRSVAGEFELRLELRGAVLRSFEVRPANDSAAAASAVSQCVGAELQRTRGKLRATHITASFRFALR